MPVAALAVVAVVGIAALSAILARKADKNRVRSEQEQREEIVRAVDVAFRVNRGNIAISRIRSKEILARQTATAIGTLRASTATRVGRSSNALVASALASGFIAQLDVQRQSVAQVDVLKSQRDQQLAGLAVPQSTPGIAFLAGLQGLQTGLSIATSIQTLSSG